MTFYYLGDLRDGLSQCCFMFQSCLSLTGQCGVAKPLGKGLASLVSVVWPNP